MYAIFQSQNVVAWNDRVPAYSDQNLTYLTCSLYNAAYVVKLYRPEKLNVKSYRC